MIACAAIAAALLAATPGSTIAAEGTCPAVLRIPPRDYGGVTLDMRAAQVPEGVIANGIKGLSIRGGTYGRADVDIAAWHTIRVDNAADFSLSEATVVGNGDARGSGVLVATSRRITIRDSLFTGHATGIGVRSSSDILVARNRILASTADGINIVDDQRGVVAANECRDFVPAPGAHPDCIQLFSLAGKPLQANIWVINNLAIGHMQAFLSSDPKTGSGRRLFFHGNYAAVSFTHTITCGACVESVATGNVLANLPTSANAPGPVKGMEAAGNLVADNLVHDARGNALPPRRWSFVVPTIWNRIGSKYDDRAFNPATVEAGQ